MPPSSDPADLDLASLLSGDNAAFLDDTWRAWAQDPASVDPAWARWFEKLGDGPVNGAAAPAPGPDRRSIFAARGGTAALDAGAATAIAHRQSAVVQFINAWRVRGHFLADIDPLQRRAKHHPPELTPGYYGLGDADLDAVVPTAPMFGMPPMATIRDIEKRLRAAYAGSIGAEFMNIDDLEQKRWVQRQLEELPDNTVLDRDQELRVLRKLCDAENFERMLHTRFPGTKRFSLEGGETLIPLLDMLVGEAARRGVVEVVMGMAHRGRLNVLVNTLEKPVRLIVQEFEDSRGPTQGSGDVKYHLGYSSDVVTGQDALIHLSLTPNPSHLEVVNPVVEGRVRAKQDRVGDTDRSLALPLLLHGDAAFIGQGSVAETFQLSELAGYRTGGTVHVVINNQIGFTTPPMEGRSTPYATDMARMMGIPILHVNGEDPRAVAAVVQLAVEWRQTYHRDIVIDMYCYRKHGHNEGDEPSFTQPLMYEQIRQRPTPRENYAKRLVELGRVSSDDVERIFEASRNAMDEGAGGPQVDEAPVPRPELPETKSDDPDTALYLEQGNGEVNPSTKAEVSPLKGRWESYTDGDIREEVFTGVPLERLQGLLERANTLPEGFHAHAKVQRLVRQRQEMAQGERPLDWAMAEQAAFASLVTEGFAVRLSGQDSGRGTFSQRHAVWADVETGLDYFSLSHLEDDQRPFWAIDSNLSELAVLGFEFGYSLDTPDALVLWEAQFGDFANGAQVIVDQFISSSEQKWGRLSGLVMLLPHAYEGQGPEHSSAKLERYLLQCAQNNMQVANCTTPANYFHILRRQVVRHVRKPLILMTPKSLLRHPEATSSLEELANGVFRRVIADPRDLDDGAVQRVVFCSGHVYYDLLAALADHPHADRVAVHRIELLYPFPAADVLALLGDLPDTTEFVWCQEEPENMGAWPVVRHWMTPVLPAGRTLRYVGRPAAASPATGSHSAHKRQQDALVSAALTLGDDA
ncbi:MAG: 2-oxoglutarate dehydrogenase E1 component [Alphaproteobacteria bacterium]|nr:2-oxoglutarate dehydrogenase E1 component [Alphaproteobacteria bacterium]